MNGDGNNEENNEQKKRMIDQEVTTKTHTNVGVQLSSGILLGLSVVLVATFLYAGFLAGFAAPLQSTSGGDGQSPATGTETWYRTESGNPTDWPFVQNTNNIVLWSDINPYYTFCADSVGDDGVYQSITTDKTGRCGLNSIETNPRVPLLLMENMIFSITGNLCQDCQAPGNGYNFFTQWSDDWLTGWNSAGCPINEFPTVCSTGTGFTLQALFDDDAPWRFKGYRMHTFDHGGTLHVRLTSRATIGDPPPPPPPGGGGSPAVLKAPPEYINQWMCEFFGECY